MAGSSADTFPTPSDVAYDVGNIKVEEDIDMKDLEEVNVKTEKVEGSEEEEFLDIKDEDATYSEEEQEEAHDINTKEEEVVDRNEEVSWEDTVVRVSCDRDNHVST
jgi:hypothetical protein